MRLEVHTYGLYHHGVAEDWAGYYQDWHEPETAPTGGSQQISSGCHGPASNIGGKNQPVPYLCRKNRQNRSLIRELTERVDFILKRLERISCPNYINI